MEFPNLRKWERYYYDVQSHVGETLGVVHYGGVFEGGVCLSWWLCPHIRDRRVGEDIAEEEANSPHGDKDDEDLRDQFEALSIDAEDAAIEEQDRDLSRTESHHLDCVGYIAYPLKDEELVIVDGLPFSIAFQRSSQSAGGSADDDENSINDT